MVDWAGHDGSDTATRYRLMAERQVRGVSPTYERLCLGVAGDAEVVDLLNRLPAPKRQPNLLLGSVRYLDGPVDSYPAFRGFVRERWDELERLMSQRRTQTNEPRRCASLLPALAALPQPLALLEVGASAGLCLYPDRYAYRYGDGATVGESPVVLECAIKGGVPVPTVLPTIAWRAGLDLNPLDVNDDDDVRWLRALVWPEQTDRLEVLARAVELARAEPVRVVQGDLTRDVRALAENAPANATLVIFHSAVLAYLDDFGRAMFRRQVAELMVRRHTVWLSNEGPGVVVGLDVPHGPVPFVLARDGRALARTGPHGDWLDWMEAA